MKLHLPIGLRKALMAVFAALAVSPAMAKDVRDGELTKIEGTNAVLDSYFKTDDVYKTTGGLFNKTYYYGGKSLKMTGSDTNSIVTGFLASSSLNWNVSFTVTTTENVVMSTASGVNTISGNCFELNTLVKDLTTSWAGLALPVSKAAPTVDAGGNVIMQGAANSIMLGSNVTGVNITMTNTTPDMPISVTSADAVLKGLFSSGHWTEETLMGIDTIQNMLNSVSSIKGNFNIVQGSKVGDADTQSVTMHTSMGTNSLAANIVLGGSEVKAKDIELSGMANVIVDTSLENIMRGAVGYASTKQIDLSQLLAGSEGVTTTLDSGNNLKLDSIINMVYGGNKVNLIAGADIYAGGALNVIGGNTTMTANNIELKPYRSVSINKLANELGSQLGGFLPFDLSTITGELGALANQNVNASVVAGGANLKATALTNVAEGQDAGGDIVLLDATAGIVVNTEVTDILDAAMKHLATDDPHKMLFAKDVLMSGTATSLEASRDINMGAQLNVLHGGGFTAEAEGSSKIAEGVNTLTITAGNDVTLHGAANLVSGNVQVNAGSRNDKGEITHEGNIHMQGYPLSPQLAGAVAGLANGYLQIEDPANSPVSGMIGKLTQKGSFNVVTGGATLDATGDIIMDAESVDDVGKVGNINAVLDTQLTDVITAVINGEPSAILPTDKAGVLKPTTTLTAGGDIDMLGRVNVVAGLRGNVVVNAAGNVELQGNISMVAGNASVTGKTININTDEAEKYKMYIDSAELGILPGGITLPEGLETVGMNAAVVAGGANLTSKDVDDKGNGITIGGTVGLLMNTSVADAIKEFNPLNPGKNASELEIVESLLQKGEATTLTAEKGNILVGSQFNLMHGGNFTFKEGTDEIDRGKNSLVLNAKAGDINVEGTANVVSGNVVLNAGSRDAEGKITHEGNITMTGEVLSADLSKAANGLVGSLVGGMNIPGVDKLTSTGILDKLVNKGSVNMVTGGAMLDATGDIIMTGKSVDDVGKIGNINAVIDTELVDVLEAKDGDFGSLVDGGGYMTTLKADGNIKLEGRVNLVNGTYVTLNAGKDVDLNGNISMISGGAKVTANNIKLNDDETGKLQMYFDSEELGAILPAGSPITKLLDKTGITDLLGTTGVNGAIVAGGAQLTAKALETESGEKIGGDITTGGTVSLLVNTPLSEVMTELQSYLNHKQEVFLVDQLLQKGTATTVHADGNINLASRLNMLHGGNMGNADDALKLTAGNDIKMSGTLNMVSGNVTMNADSINMTGEALKYDLGDGLAGMQGAEVLDKLATYGSANVVLGGATLTATGEEGITMKGLANAVLDVELVDATEAFMDRPDMSALIDGGAYETKLYAEKGDINLLGRLNVVNGGKVVLDADAGDVNLQGNASLISGGATVDAKNININTDESADYKIYIDSTDLGGLVSENSPFAPIVDSISGIGVNAGIVAGGAKLTATDNITIGGTLGLVVNTPMSSVMTEVVSYLGHMQETWMVSELLKPGTATKVEATNGNIEVGAQFNLLHGGGFTANAGENALVLSAANGAVNVEGTFNVVSGNTQVTAQEINMTGEILPADMAGAVNGVVDSVVDRFIGELPEAADNLLDRLVGKGNANMVTGGATLTATGENGITMSGAANAVIDTELTDVFEAFMERTSKPLEEGGNHQTTLTSAGNINMLGRLNVVNGSYVKLDADQDVNLKGTLNMVSGGAKVHGNNINLVGQQNLGLNWDSLLPGDVGNYMDQMGVTDKLNKGVNGNLVLGGAMIEAKNDISISGMASVVMNTPLGSAFEALTTLRDNSWYPELWLAKDVLDDGIATTLKADGNIEMDSRLNMLHGGNIGNADAALKLTAGKEVNIAGTANIISGNTQVTAGEGIKITGKNSVGFDWNQIAKALPEKYAGYGKLAGEMGILDKLSKGVNGSVIAGGATLTAESGDITMEGMATAVVDVTAENVLTAVETMNGTPIMEGGAEDTTITAKEGSINLNSRLNLVNGGQVTVDAGKNVNMGGTFNVVSGNATVNAGTNIEMNAQNKVGVDITPMLNGHYAEIAKEMGMADVLENGVSSNIVAGGANLQAEGDVKMSGVATAIVDTTASNVIGAVKGNDLGELMKGGRSTTEVTAGNDIKLVSQMNVVNGGNSQNAGGVVLNAGHDVIMSGDIDVVNRATVKAGNEVAFNGDKSVVKYSDINAKTVSFTGKNAEITDVNFNTASVEVIGTALVNTADSEVAINELLVDAGNIENLGSLELKDAALAGATLHNAGSIAVNGAMTLNSATLSFVADSNNSTFNSTAITLGAEGSIAGISTFSGNGSEDMIAGVSFLLHYDGIEFIENTNEFKYNLAIFQGATSDEHKMLEAAIAQEELTLTLDNGYNVERITSMNVLFDDGVVYISGTATVPEPTTATLSLLALAALAARRRRQK